MSVALVVIGIGICLFLVIGKKTQQHHDYLSEFNKTYYVESMSSDHQAVDIASLSDQTFKQAIIQRWLNLQRQLGTFSVLKLVLYVLLLIGVSFQVNQQFIRESIVIVSFITVLLGLFFGYRWLNSRERKQFDQSFPDALNMLTSAVSAGESIMHAIIYVGNTLDGEVGKEFKMMFNARSVEKKKYAMTAEARTSAKIVGAIPFAFLFMLQYLSPENYEFVMFHPEGKPILYYVLISEFVGISVVWGLMKGVR